MAYSKAISRNWRDGGKHYRHVKITGNTAENQTRFFRKKGTYDSNCRINEQ